MVRKIMYLFLSIFIFTSLISCTIDDMLNVSISSTIEDSDVILIEDLIDTENFRQHALAHILEGEINRNGQAVGYHYEGLPTSKGKVIFGTETSENEFGVYEAEVEVEGIKKTSNRGMSTFFPKHWTAQQVVDAINEAYRTRDLLHGNTYEGLTNEGMVIRMYLDEHEKIISAFPIYE